MPPSSPSSQGLPVVVTHDVPRGGAWIEAAYVETAALPAYGAELSISKA